MQRPFDMPNKLLLDVLSVGFKCVYKKNDIPFKQNEIHNILIINTTAIGDTILSTPAIRAIRHGFPDAGITALTSNAAKTVLLHDPHLDKIIDHPGKVDFFYIFKLPALLKKIRQGKFDLVVILHANDPDAAPLAYLSGAPHRMGWAESKLAFLHTMPVRTRVPGVHIITTRLKNLEQLGIKTHDTKTGFFLSGEEKKQAEKFIAELGLAGKELIGIHPFGSKINKWWPSDNVVKFCEMIKKELDRQVLIFGGKKESGVAADIAQGTKNAISVAGRIDVRGSAALIQRCKAFISTDSGPMHIAQSLGVPLIALFGPDDPVVTGPQSQPYGIIQKKIPCVPCMLKTCDRNMECMKEITSAEVMEALQRMLKEIRPIGQPC